VSDATPRCRTSRQLAAKASKPGPSNGTHRPPPGPRRCPTPLLLECGLAHRQNVPRLLHLPYSRSSPGNCRREGVWVTDGRAISVDGDVPPRPAAGDPASANLVRRWARAPGRHAPVRSDRDRHRRFLSALAAWASAVRCPRTSARTGRSHRSSRSARPARRRCSTSMRGLRRDVRGAPGDSLDPNAALLSYTGAPGRGHLPWREARSGPAMWVPLPREAFEQVAVDPALAEVTCWIHPVLTMLSESLIIPVQRRRCASSKRTATRQPHANGPSA
jgi:hypothetical protein